MANRMISEESDEEFQEIQHTRLQQAYRHAREDQREVNIEKKDQLRTQKFVVFLVNEIDALPRQRVFSIFFFTLENFSKN